MIDFLRKNCIYFVLQLVIFLAISIWFYQQNQPSKIASPILENQKLQCVSYAPYYGKNQSPLVLGTQISHAQIDADLKKLAEITHCVRTYSVSQGLDYVPEAASKLGLKVYLGAWIGWTNLDNEKEVKLAAATAKAFPDTVKALIIGNEVFLRGEQKEAAMQRYINMARNLTSTPITYADVWEFWKKHPAMEAHVDFITVHILPYWEDNPIEVDHAVTHTKNIMAELSRVFKKPLLIGETGWPSIGRQRNKSTPSLLNQARYVREFLQAAQENGWQYNVIEAIDQPWKRNLEGTVGGYWGFLSTDLTPKFSFDGAVANRADGSTPILFAVLGAALLLGLALWKNESRKLLLLAFAMLGAAFGLMLLLQVEYLLAACRDNIEWLALGLTTFFASICILLQPWANNPQAIHQPLAKKSQNFIQLSFIALIIANIVTGYLIFSDGRYRDFPTLLLLLPAITLAIHRLLGLNPFYFSKIFTRVLAGIALILAAMCFWQETANTSAMVWLAINALCFIASWPKHTHSPN